MLALLLAASTAYGTGFTLPIPKNFHEEGGASASIKRDGGVMLEQQVKLELPGAVTANVIVTAVKEGDIDSARPAVCEKLAQKRAKDGAALLKQGARPTPWGPACQYEVTAPKKGKQAATRVTIAAAKGKFSTITCNYDQRDEGAQQACDEVVAGFRMD